MSAQRLIQKSLVYVRKHLYNSPLHHSKILNAIYAPVVRWAWKDDTSIAEYFGAHFVLPEKDITITPGVRGGYYERLELEIFQNLAKASNSIFDVGGNIGLFAVIGAKSNPSAQIVTFEPVAENQILLEKNVKLNDIQNVTIVPKAVGEKDGSVILHLSRENAGTHSAVPSSMGDFQSKIEVDMTTLDTYAQTHAICPDLIKIDVEGYDIAVMAGAQQLLQKYVPTVFVELSPLSLSVGHYGVSELRQIIRNLNVQCFAFNHKQDGVYKVTDLDALDTLGYTNLIFSSRPEHIRVIQSFM